MSIALLHWSADTFRGVVNDTGQGTGPDRTGPDRRVRASASVTTSACTLLYQSALLCSFVVGHLEGSFVQNCLEAPLNGFSVNNKRLFLEIKRPEPEPDHVPHNNAN